MHTKNNPAGSKTAYKGDIFADIIPDKIPASENTTYKYFGHFFVSSTLFKSISKYENANFESLLFEKRDDKDLLISITKIPISNNPERIISPFFVRASLDFSIIIYAADANITKYP